MPEPVICLNLLTSAAEIAIVLFILDFGLRIAELN
jgi:hypothetical protein